MQTADMGAGANTLGTRLDARDNSLNLVRLVLAVAVIVSHAFLISGFDDDPQLGGMGLGDWAVAGFFALSGWLITASRLHSTGRDFARRRLVRIYPAFFVSLLAVAFVFAPLSTILGSGAYSPSAGLEYVTRNAFVLITREGIEGTLVGAPWGGTWNVSVWTLFHELVCYLVVGLVVTLAPRAAVPMVLLGLWVAATFIQVSAWLGSGDDGNPIERLLAFFLSGALLYIHRDRVPASARWVVAAVLALVACVVLSASWALAGVPIAYLLMWVGASKRVRVARVHDVSYGMYVYGFPVQHLLWIVVGRDLGVAGFAVLSIASTAPLAVASWLLVERPAMRHRSKVAAADPVGRLDRPGTRIVATSAAS